MRATWPRDAPRPRTAPRAHGGSRHRWAAAHTLDYVPERASNVLEAMAVEGPTPAIRIAAEMTLRMWRAGRLRFP